MVKVKMLGVVGSPRFGGNTETLVKEALAGATETSEVDAETIHLGSYKIEPCRACEVCPPKNKLCIIDDDMQKLYDKLIEADALVIGSPVYFGDVSGQLKVFIDRTRPLARGAGGYKLRMKVAGAIVVASNPFGGSQFTIRAIHVFFTQHRMVIVGGPWEHPEYWDVCGVATKLGEITKDEGAMKAAKSLGKRIAEITKALKSCGL